MGLFGRKFGIPFGAIDSATYNGFYSYSSFSQVSCSDVFSPYGGEYFVWNANSISDGMTGTGSILAAPGIVSVGTGSPPAGFSLFSSSSNFTPTISGATGGKIWAFRGFSNFRKPDGFQHITVPLNAEFDSGGLTVPISVSTYISGKIQSANVIVGDIFGATGFNIGDMTISIDPPFGTAETLFSGATGLNYLGISGFPSGEHLPSRRYDANAGNSAFSNSDGLFFGATSIGNWILDIDYTGASTAIIGFVTLALDHERELTDFSLFTGTTVEECISYSGVSGYAGTDLTFIPTPPKIIAPDTLTPIEETSNRINWEPLQNDFLFSNANTKYDLEYTDNFDSDNGWTPIQNGIKGTTFAFQWDNSGVPNTNNLGLRIRSRLHGIPSSYYKVPGPITIAPRPPESPILLSPLGSEVYDRQMPIIWQPANPTDIDGNDITYTLQYSRSASNDQGWRNISSGLSSSVTSYLFDTSELSPGEDYGIRLFAVASDTGQTSEIQIVIGLKIRHSGLIIVDTLPPEAEIIIEDDMATASDKHVKIRMHIEDETSGVKSIRLKNEGDENFSAADSPVREKLWVLSEGDGYKNVLLEAEDYAGNKTNNLELPAIIRRFKQDGEFFDAEQFQDAVYIATGNDVAARLYGFKAVGYLVHQFESGETQITGLKAFKNKLFIAVATSDNIGRIYTYDGATIKLSKDFLVTDTVIRDFGSYIDPDSPLDETMFIGLSNGEIYKYISQWILDFTASAPITTFSKVNALLLGGIENTNKFAVYNGVWQEIEF